VNKTFAALLSLLAVASFAGANQMERDLLALANSGNANAMYMLGELYLVGNEKEGVEPNPNKSIYWHEKNALTSGNVLSAYKAGRSYMAIATGAQCPLNAPCSVETAKKRAFEMFAIGMKSIPSEAGYACAALHGALNMRFNDYKEAEKSLKIGAKGENPVAQIYLAFLYNEQGNKEGRANELLTAACNNPRSDQSIIDYCRSEEIEAIEQ
jgi:TPR repeat protein